MKDKKYEIKEGMTGHECRAQFYGFIEKHIGRVAKNDKAILSELLRDYVKVHNITISSNLTGLQENSEKRNGVMKQMTKILEKEGYVHVAKRGWCKSRKKV